MAIKQKMEFAVLLQFTVTLPMFDMIHKSLSLNLFPKNNGLDSLTQIACTQRSYMSSNFHPISIFYSACCHLQEVSARIERHSL